MGSIIGASNGLADKSVIRPLVVGLKFDMILPICVPSMGTLTPTCCAPARTYVIIVSRRSLDECRVPYDDLLFGRDGLTVHEQYASCNFFSVRVFNNDACYGRIS